MSVGLRKDRAAIFAYQDLGSQGEIQSTYVQIEGPLADKKWWCRLEDVSGQQITVASKAEEHIDAIIFFQQDIFVPAKGCIEINDVLFKILNVRPRPSTQEQAVYCVFVDDPDFTLSATGSLIQPVSTSFSIVPTTSSHAATADTASYALFSVVSPSTNSFSLNSDLAISASHALTASFAPQSTTASLALFAISGTGNFEGVFSGSFVGTSSIRRFTFPFTDATPFEMFLVSQSGETEYQTQGRKKFDLTNFTESRITAQVVVTGSVSAAIGFQYSLDEGSTWAYLDGLSGPTASIATLGPVSSSYVTIVLPAKSDVLLRWVAVSGSGTGTPVIGNVCLGLIQDATIVANSALSASWALSASFADQALHADTATTASYSLEGTHAFAADTATSASHALNADNAISASYALSASHALAADTAISASHALNTDVAISASHALQSDAAISASYATTSSFASNVLVASTGFTVSGSLTVTGALNVTGNINDTGYAITASAFKGDGSQITGVVTASFADEVLKATGGFRVSQSLQVTGSTYSTNLIINGVNGLGYAIFPTQSTDPATPGVGSLLLHATDENGFSRLGINNEAAVDIVVARDMMMIARNSSGAAISKGNIVFISGSSGNNPTIGLAHASASETSPAFGYAMKNIANNAFGPVMMQGLLTGLNTNTFNVNDRLYLSPVTAGGSTTTRPTNPNFVQAVGTVLVVHATQGVIAVSIAGSLLNRETGTNQTSWTAAGAVTASAFKGDGAGITGVVSVQSASTALHALSSDNANIAQFATQSADSFHAITASFAHQARSASHANEADVVNGQGSGSFTGSFLGISTGTFTGSYTGAYTGVFIGDGTSVINVVTSSYSLRSGVALTGTGSFTGSFIGQHTGALQLKINSEQSGSQFTHQRIDLGGKSANFSISFDSGNIQRFAASASLKFEITGMRPGGFYVVEVFNSGAFNILLPNNLLYPDGLPFTGSAETGTLDVFTFYQAGNQTIVSPFARRVI